MRTKSRLLIPNSFCKPKLVLANYHPVRSLVPPAGRLIGQLDSNRSIRSLTSLLSFDFGLISSFILFLLLPLDFSFFV